MREVTTKLTLFQSGLLILGGDLNVPLDPLVDTSTGTSSLPFSALQQIKTQLASLSLHDTWRTLNPKERDYTFFSSPHNRYSRLDYLFVTQPDLTYLHKATIESMILSDHHPITMTLVFPETVTTTKMWRLDASTLADPGDLADLRQGIQDFFLHNDTPDVSPMTQREAHKCVIRGQLLAISVRKKRENQARILELSTKICKLKAQHKRTLAINISQELVETRLLLLGELLKRVRRRNTLSQKLFYEQGNKPGRLLARATQQCKVASTIHHIVDTAGKIHSKNEDIARQFHLFYSNLYNLQTGNTDAAPSITSATLIKKFLLTLVLLPC